MTAKHNFRGTSDRDALIQIGLLDRADRNSKNAVRKALDALFERHLYL